MLSPFASWQSRLAMPWRFLNAEQLFTTAERPTKPFSGQLPSKEIEASARTPKACSDPDDGIPSRIWSWRAGPSVVAASTTRNVRLSLSGMANTQVCDDKLETHNDSNAQASNPPLVRCCSVAINSKPHAIPSARVENHPPSHYSRSFPLSVMNVT